MGEHGSRGGTLQARIEADVHLRDHVRHRANLGRQQPQDLSLTLLAMPQLAANE